MRKLLLFLVCLIPGILTTSCLIIEDKTYVYDVPSDDVIFCEPANETHYSVYSITPNKTKTSSLIPYICDDKDAKAVEVIEVCGSGDYIDNGVVVESAKYYKSDGFDLVKKTYKVSLFFDTYIIPYYFVVDLPKRVSQECRHYEPSFELIDCQIKRLGEEIDGDKLYECSEATITLRAYQGEKMFDFVKTVKLRQELVSVSFDITISSGYEGDDSVNI